MDTLFSNHGRTKPSKEMGSAFHMLYPSYGVTSIPNALRPLRYRQTLALFQELNFIFPDRDLNTKQHMCNDCRVIQLCYLR